MVVTTVKITAIFPTKWCAFGVVEEKGHPHNGMKVYIPYQAGKPVVAPSNRVMFAKGYWEYTLSLDQLLVAILEPGKAGHNDLKAITYAPQRVYEIGKRVAASRPKQRR
ncbi:MAG: hypothetical protein WCG97_00555 [bacterium]